jgi:hypothetical protein
MFNLKFTRLNHQNGKSLTVFNVSGTPSGSWIITYTCMADSKTRHPISRRILSSDLISPLYSRETLSFFKSLSSLSGHQHKLPGLDLLLVGALKTDQIHHRDLRLLQDWEQKLITKLKFLNLKSILAMAKNPRWLLWPSWTRRISNQAPFWALAKLAKQWTPSTLSS